MAKMKVQDFIAKAKKLTNVYNLYKLGTFLNKKTGTALLSDCSGLIKGILWGYPENGKYASNGVPDINANSMILRCSKVSTNFNKLPIGALVWISGHIGIHVGNGVCVESTPIWEDGIQYTFIKGSGYSNTRKLHERKWTKHGLFDKYIDYTSTTPAPAKPKIEYLNLDPTVAERTVYNSKLSKVGLIKPKKFGGLSYKILGYCNNDRYVRIKTSTFGEVRICIDKKVVGNNFSILATRKYKNGD